MKPQDIPATGVLEYRHIAVTAPNPEDSWLGAIVVRPGNRKVVHHVIVRAKYPGAHDDGTGRGAWLAAWAPGYLPVRFPEGTGRFIPKGARLDFEMHYTTMGAAQIDQTELGFYLLAAKPKLALETTGAVNMDFAIL